TAVSTSPPAISSAGNAERPPIDRRTGAANGVELNMGPEALGPGAGVSRGGPTARAPFPSGGGVICGSVRAASSMVAGAEAPSAGSSPLATNFWPHFLHLMRWPSAAALPRRVTPQWGHVILVESMAAPGCGSPLGVPASRGRKLLLTASY